VLTKRQEIEREVQERRESMNSLTTLLTGSSAYEPAKILCRPPEERLCGFRPLELNFLTARQTRETDGSLICPGCHMLLARRTGS